jgi:hypothetical protein
MVESIAPVIWRYLFSFDKRAVAVIGYGVT